MAKKDYRLLSANVYRDKSIAQYEAGRERKQHRALGVEVRVYPRSIRAGGTRLELFVVVVRVPLYPTPAAVVASHAADAAAEPLQGDPFLEGAQ